ncbi:helix-turn-helix domain-containing protein [Labrenzia sp. R4_2]|uniref:helix-turn-helix domain-containing protein n=1 Tax=Labrenzia sp. R4_2 TaxID=2821107 RepID=UPI001ADA58AA|nr:helix-turn-helix domain-containing protein [Labrenzia sp. R4_2]MBO9421746.1 helix-turn-helix domain-containing protein [Labrenzia sp. R4_2]
MAKPLHPPFEGWDRYSILAEIQRQGMTLSELADRAGMKPNAFGHVWTRTVRKAEAVIAEFLETDPAVLWPDRYPITSHRIYDIRKHGPSTSQKRSVSADKVAAA